MMDKQPAHSPRWILVPGTLCTPEVFAPLMTQLDVPGENQTFIDVDLDRVDEYAARLQAFVQPGDIVCGFSLGALVLAHNLEALQQAKAIVLLALNPCADAAGGRQKREQIRDRVLAGDAAGWVTENWGKMSTGGDALRDQVIDMAEATVGLMTAQTELAASRPSAADNLKRTRQNILLITGAQDQLTPAANLCALSGSFAKNITLVVLNGLGHFALLEAPNCISNVIHEHILKVVR